MSEIFLTELDVSRKMKISLATLRRWRLEGRGPRYRKFGSLVRYGENELENWMNAQPCGGDPAINTPDSTKTRHRAKRSNP
jgi:predicted DNA-binding transcriptional regulator AlpA